MKRILVILFAILPGLALADSLCDYYSPACASKKQAFDQSLTAINKANLPGGISAIKAVSLIVDTYPNDPVMTSLANQLELIAATNLPDATKETLSDSAFAIVASAYQDRKSLVEFARVLNERQQQAQYDQAQYEAYDPNESMRRTLAVTTLLSGIGKAFATSYGQSILPPPTICNSYGGTTFCYPPY